MAKQERQLKLVKTLQKQIRIVIPAFKATNTIQKCVEAVLKAIAFYETWEIIIVDNGQNPQLINLLKNYPIKVLKRDENQSAAYARNEGAKGFLNGILVFIDSDVICEKECIQNLIKPLQNNLCHATIGNYSKNLKGLSFSQKYKQLYINHIYSRGDSKIKNDFWTAICSVDAIVFNKLNGFNTNFKGANGEDQEFGIRITKNGYHVLSVKNANGQHLNPYGILNIIRNDFKKGLIAVKNSLENKVPFSDNRHSKTKDILAVFFSVMTLLFVTISTLQINFLYVCSTTFILWLIFRRSLSITFFKSGGPIFFIKTLLLMFCLDFIRFMCVIIGFVKFKLLKFTNKEKVLITTIHIKS